MNNPTPISSRRDPYFCPARRFGNWQQFLAVCLILGMAALSQSARSQTLVGEWLNGAANLTDVSGFSPAGTFDGYAVGSAAGQGTFLYPAGNYVFTNDVPPGQTGQSLWFNAADTAIAITNTSTLDGAYNSLFDGGTSNAFTIALWAKGMPGQWNPWVSKYGEGSQFGPVEGGWQIRNDGSFSPPTYSMFTVRNGQIGVANTAQTTTPNANADDMGTRAIATTNGGWHYYVGTFSTATGIRTLYVDGLLAAQEISNTAPVVTVPISHLVIGGQDDQTGTNITKFFSGQIYDVRIYNGALSAAQVATLVGNIPPAINTQPTSQNVFQGTTTSFTVGGVTGTTPLTYQWKFNGTNLVNNTNILGATTSTLTISNAATTNAGTYTLAISNAYGSTLSSNLVVSVQTHFATPTNAYPAQVLTNSPVAFWQLNETNDFSPGGVLAYDYSGHGFYARYGVGLIGSYLGLTGPQPPTYPGFAANQGAVQIGTATNADSVVTVPNLNLSTNTVDTTITMWINPYLQPPASAGLFFNRGTDAAGLCFGTVKQTGGSTEIGYTWNNAAATYNYNSQLFPPIGVWSFVALVVQSNQATMYLDYVDPNTATPVISAPAVNTTTHTPETFTGGTTWIGGDSLNGARFFPGNIADVAIYHTALNGSQISQLFAQGLGVSSPQIPLSGQPVSVYAFTGDTKTFKVTGILGTSLTYQWQLNGTNLVNGANFSGVNTNVLTVNNVAANDVGNYQLVLMNNFGTVVSSNASLTIQTPHLVGEWLNGPTNFAEVSGYSPAGTFDGYIVGGGVYTFTNDVPPGKTGQSLFFTDATTPGAGTALAISNTSTLDTGYSNTFDNAIVSAFSVSFWAKGLPGQWNPWVSKWGESEGGWQLRQYASSGQAAFTVRDNNAGGATLGIAGDDMGTQIFPSGSNAWHLYDGVFNSATGERSLYIDGNLVAHETNNVPYNMATAEHLVFGGKDSPPGNTFGNYGVMELYDVQIYNYGISSNAVTTLYGTSNPVTISGQPRATVTGYLGLQSQISASGISGNGPFTYYWQLNGTNLVNGTNYSGVNTATLTINPVNAGNAGTYTLLVSNAFGTALSSGSVVTVATPYMVGRWFNGSSSLAEVSGYAPPGTHDGYAVGNATNWYYTNDVPSGRSGVSIHLNGATAIAVTNSSNLDGAYTNDYDDTINNAFTVMTWAKGWPGNWNPWVSKLGEGSTGWQLRTDGASGGAGTAGYACFTIRNGGKGTAILGAAVSGASDDMATRSIHIGTPENGNWHHYAGVFDLSSGIRSLYVDGVLAAQENNNTAPPNSAAVEHLVLGGRDANGTSIGNFFTGNLYDSRIYNFPMNQLQIQTTAMVRPKVTQASTNGNLVITWPYGTLQEATNLAGPWTVNTNKSPFTVPVNPALSGKFYRVALP